MAGSNYAHFIFTHHMDRIQYRDIDSKFIYQNYFLNLKISDFYAILALEVRMKLVDLLHSCVKLRGEH